MSQSIDSEEVKKLDSVLERLFRKMKVQSSANMLGLTATQLFVMRYLSLTSEAKSSDIARTAGLSPGAITQVCDELVRLGFVERVRSNEDRRVVYVCLTESGQAELQKFLAQRTMRLKELMDKLGESDARELMRLLDRLVEVLETEAPH